MKRRCKYFIFSGLIILIIGCTTEKLEKKEIDDANYVLYSEYKKGDARRYGVFPDSLNNKKHPKTGKSKIQSLIDFAEKYNDTIFFQEGYYGVNLSLDSRKNIYLHFNNSEFNSLLLTNEKGENSSNINISGKIILYDRLGTYHSHNIKIDSIIIKSDSKKHLANWKSRGFHIYKGTKDMYVKYAEIHDLASGEKIYQNNHAALALDGLRENPENITIDKVRIISSDRHGVYVTGTNNKIGELIIEKYAQGSVEGMTGMQDSGKGEEKILSGLWINRCNGCEFKKVVIISKESKKGKYILKLDEGSSGSPTVIDNLCLDVDYSDDLILDNIHTNILVKKLTKISNE